jgi:energy-coupling factor transport system permease protein
MNNVLIYIALLIYIFIIIKLTKIKIYLFLKSIENIFKLILFTSILNIFFTRTGKLLFSFYFLKITTHGLYYALNSALKFLIMILSSSILILTTSPSELSNAFISILYPFRKIIPVNDLSMILNISLRFIPVISREFESIIKSQIARGINFKSKNIIDRIKNYLALLIPVFVLSFKRADNLAFAMESRCYNPQNNRNFKKIKFKKKDYFLLLIQISIITITLYVNFNIEKK